MKTSWLVWTLTVGILITIFIAFNYKKDNDVIPLSEIFEEEVYPVDIEYEFVDKDDDAVIDNNDFLKDKKSNVTTNVSENREKVKNEIINDRKSLDIPLKNGNKQKKYTKNISHDKFYAVQIASFRIREKAVEKVKEVRLRGFDGYIFTRNLGDKGKWYRVYVGRFLNRKDAIAMLNEIKRHYKDSFIISVK